MYSTNDCYFIRHRHSPTAIAKYLLCVLFSFTHTLRHPVRMVSILMSFFVYIFAIAFEHRMSVFVIIMCRSHQLNDGVDVDEWVGCQHTTLSTSDLMSYINTLSLDAGGVGVIAIILARNRKPKRLTDSFIYRMSPCLPVPACFDSGTVQYTTHTNSRDNPLWDWISKILQSIIAEALNYKWLRVLDIDSVNVIYAMPWSRWYVNKWYVRSRAALCSVASVIEREWLCGCERISLDRQQNRTRWNVPETKLLACTKWTSISERTSFHSFVAYFGFPVVWCDGIVDRQHLLYNYIVVWSRILCLIDKFSVLQMYTTNICYGLIRQSTIVLLMSLSVALSDACLKFDSARVHRPISANTESNSHERDQLLTINDNNNNNNINYGKNKTERTK